ncbi:hypothetical protein G6F55_006795 [Rhizopus delemar]|uniref:Uncharacterized protein n=2 Tax=Rhizopus TaxID=4842 RepID=A0A9P7CIQ4_9FUNG|nr:hypothetical protein G6F55_006795 [Rhizopus delemar]KAG1535345.1 hypothetical protein G6F51_011587 [Rhizopus arrhizus]KAG1511306.1 hypothetical protein G6F52_010684 [Rhizopus delemar]KAG1549452.1 hypothetical protein G6F49_009591 [Rhizopus delemar]KAG1564073.1 hypothetical protein G6F50_011380 [Rhizopus delemar]
MSKRRTKVGVPLPQTHPYYDWFKEQLHAEKMDYFSFVKETRKSREETDRDYKYLIDVLIKEKAKYKLDMAFDALQEFESRNQPGTKFYEQYTDYWNKVKEETKDDVWVDETDEDNPTEYFYDAAVKLEKLNRNLTLSKRPHTKQLISKALKDISESQLDGDWLSAYSILDMENSAVRNRLRKLVDKDIFDELEALGVLPVHDSPPSIRKMLDLIEKSEPHPIKMDRMLREHMSLPDSIYKDKYYDFLSADGILQHFLKQMIPGPSPITKPLLEKTLASLTIIPVINLLTNAYSEKIDVGWVDAIHTETQLKRWKGLITDVNTRDILCLINFSGGNRPKDKKDAKKHFKIEEEVYERIAMLSKEKYSKLPGSRIFVIRTIANKAYFESAAIAYGVWVRTRHFVLDWPEHGNDLKNFAKSLPNLLAFKDALLGVVPYIKMETT